MNAPVNTKSLLELVDERPAVDMSPVADKLQAILKGLRKKLDARFELTPDPSTANLQPYSSLDGATSGRLAAFTGPDIDWLVDSSIGDPKRSFSNMHLTVWLGPHIRAPHFGCAFGTMPDIFAYIDYVPRADVVTDLEHHDRYFETANESYVKLHSDARFRPFVSKALYMRTAQSPVSHCYLVEPDEDVIEMLAATAHEMLDRWLAFVAEAPEVPADERAALAARDLLVRRTVAERDPANAMGERLFGSEKTAELVSALWGGHRVLPRPTRRGR